MKNKGDRRKKQKHFLHTFYYDYIWLKNFDFFPKHKNLRQFSGNVWKIDFQIFKINCEVLKTIFQTWKSCHSKLLFFSKIRIFIFQTLLISRKESEFSKSFFSALEITFWLCLTPNMFKITVDFCWLKFQKTIWPI